MTAPVSTAILLYRVREALEWGDSLPKEGYEDAVASLAVLRERLEAAEALAVEADRQVSEAHTDDVDLELAAALDRFRGEGS